MDLPHDININKSIIKEHKNDFTQLIILILENPTFLPLGIVEFGGSHYYDFLAIHLFLVFFKSQRHVVLTKEILTYEFRKLIQNDKTTELLTPNTISHKILKEFLQNVGKTYIQQTFSDWMKSFIEQGIFSEPQTQLWTDELFKIIFNTADNLPKEFVEIIQHVGLLSDQNQLDSITYGSILLFHMYFYFSLQRPTEFGLVPNGAEFGEIQKQNLQKVILLMDKIVGLRESSGFGKKKSFEVRDYVQNTIYSNLMNEDEETSSFSIPRKQIIPMNSIDVQSYPSNSLVVFYHLLFTHAKRITDMYFNSSIRTYLSTKSSRKPSTRRSLHLEDFMINILQYLNLLRKIGHSEKMEKEIEVIHSRLEKNVVRNILEKNFQISNTDFEELGFIYGIKSNTSTEKCILYFILRRFEAFYVDGSTTPVNYMGRIIFHIIKTLGRLNSLGHPFSVVVDATLINLQGYSSRKVYDFLDWIIPLFPGGTVHFDQVYRIFLLGCSISVGGGNENEKILGNYLDYIKKKLRIRPQIFPLNKHSDLGKYIKDAMVLPFKTKTSELRFHHFKTVGDNQVGMFCLTPLSILVIHPVYKRIERELYFRDILEIMKTVDNKNRATNEDEKFVMVLKIKKKKTDGEEKLMYFCNYECYYDIFLVVNSLKVQMYTKNEFHNVKFETQEIGVRNVERLKIVTDGMVEIQKKDGNEQELLIKKEFVHLFSMVKEYCLVEEEEEEEEEQKQPTKMMLKFINLRGKKLEKIVVLIHDEMEELFTMIDDLISRREDLLVLRTKEMLKMKNEEE